MPRLAACLLSATLSGLAGLAAVDIGPQPIDRDRGAAPLWNVIDEVAGMVSNAQATGLFQQRGLSVLSLTWEDAGRWKGSAVGPNISDLTIQVLGAPRPAHHGWCMPVVRYPNFADKSCDVPIDRLRLLVGNERGAPLQRIDLRQYLQRFAQYQNRPTGWLKGDLVGDRDQVVLAAAQACFLPIPAGGAARFAPVLFNYQSQPGAPAVLAILATPEGTSAQVIDNNRQAAAGVWHGQRLFHNADGQRASLKAVRFSDHRAEQAAQGNALGDDATTKDGLSLCLVIQVPLVHPEPRREQGGGWFATPSAKPAAPAAADSAKRAGGADVETAVVSSGPVEGPWLGLDQCTIERDWRFPIRVTVQFYQATDGAQVRSQDAARIAAAIERVYLDADAVGSLVIDGHTGRPTEHGVVRPPPRALPQPWPQPWWEGPCRDYQSRTGEDWTSALGRVRNRLGADWQPASERELRNALELVRP